MPVNCFPLSMAGNMNALECRILTAKWMPHVCIAWLRQYNTDCICIVETWLNGDILDNELCIEGYDIIRLDRNRHGGGVLIYVSFTFSHNVLYSGSSELDYFNLYYSTYHHSPFLQASQFCLQYT